MEIGFMNDQAKLIESLLENASDYGKTNLEIVKLKALDKTSEIVSSAVPHTILIILITSFVIFLNLGLAFWIGNLLGEIYYGFFVIAGFYLLAGVIFNLFMHKWIKRMVCNYIIKQVLK